MPASREPASKYRFSDTSNFWRCWIKVWIIAGQGHPGIWGSEVAIELSVSVAQWTWNNKAFCDEVAPDSVLSEYFPLPPVSYRSCWQFDHPLEWNWDRLTSHRWHKNSIAKHRRLPITDGRFLHCDRLKPSLKSLFWSGQLLSKARFCFFGANKGF